ncbi:WD40 repeat-like-containing domain protein [Cordyceps fumosorosea ARSEF 2679]|uniref:WD40 repeat-like-containing domain protein n=1 Tax=Cordyceps fumosorosea (strain ARSEF 2679) TaxID=1081104 RepID=A0A167V4R6_CORFA|nr:WD40 repeat-like-containing domain protein [Cordyceps fumosorosea ARSEF 2679]OAA62225.1 WD40 repeat-like-containing domain protein [Cordyceps fumosorosea ARSEF 2679]
MAAVDIHRCRFVPYQPSAINAVAFSHPRARDNKHAAVARLAVGRANGDIEIWNAAAGIWQQELIIRGGKDRSIDGLVWVNEPDQDLGEGRILIGKSRLFSIGYTSTVTEWDLETGKPKRHASGQHGDIWCIAAQPSLLDDRTSSSVDAQGSNKLVAGTIDGELVMYSVEDNDLRFQRILVKSPTKKAQMVSIIFQSRKVVIVGCSDSTIRAYDIAKGHMLRRMTLGSDLVGGSKDIIVWSVKCLPNGNIVSGDSTGQLCIWDGKTYTQLQRLQSHKQDILSLAISADGNSIMSGGMDRKTALYKQNPGAGQRWAKVWGRRYHEHDVKTMATFEHARTSVVVSGGPDSNLVVVPLKEMGREHHRTVSGLPHQPPLISASKARFMVSWWDREIHLWLLPQPASDLTKLDGADDYDINQNRKLLKTIVVKGDSNISSASINAGGTLLIASTSTDVKAFGLKHINPTKPADVTLSSIELPEHITKLGASRVQISPDGSWLCFIQDGCRVVIASITSESSSYTISQSRRLRRLHRSVPKYILNGGLGSYERNITHIAFSPDSKVLATADLAGFIDTWVLRAAGDDTANGHANGDEGDDASADDSDSSDDDTKSTNTSEVGRWARNPNAKMMPKLPAAPSVLTFSDSAPGQEGVEDYTLAAVTSSWNVIAFNALQGSLTPWSRRHPRKALPGPIHDMLDLAKGAFWQGSRLWIYGISFLFMLDLSQDLPVADKDAGDQLVQQGTKRKRTNMSGAGGRMAKEGLKPQQIRKYAANKWEKVEIDGPSPSGDVDNESDDDMVDVVDSELTQLRATTDLEAQSGTEGEDGRKKWWITYKYRPVLGVVSFGNHADSLEVALVERPAWDIETQDSYYAGEEWERR